MGAGLHHVHLADGSGGPRDEHLVPGRGTQPCAEVLQRLADTGYSGAVVAEVSTRRCRTRYERAEMLAHALLFARLHLQPTAQRRDVTRGRKPAPAPTVSRAEKREVARPTV
jgi:sugar phosphate isomerase/epimerase